MKIRTIRLEDAEYPVILRDIYDPPAILYVKGEMLPQDKAAVALVGTRRPTHYGMQACRKLAYDLAMRGITVVSGMAVGIDTEAHRGALAAGGRTIAVLGSGHNNIYPRQNIGLYNEIAGQGAVISEFPNATAPFKWNFPRRNRIISGLSLGVVVVEAPRKSGGLLSVDFALEQGREVFALPGRAGALTSEGTHRLIKEGARLAESADDIIEEIGARLDKLQGPSGAESRVGLRLSAQEERVFKLLTDEPRDVDTLLEESGMPVSAILSSLTQLTVKRLAQELPGKRFVTASRR